MGFLQTVRNYTSSIVSKAYSGPDYHILREQDWTTKSWEELKSNTVLVTSNGSPGTLTPTVSVQQSLNKYRTWVYPCVDLIKRHASAIPFYMKQDIDGPDNENFKKILNHPIIRLLKYPNKFMSGKQFRETVFMHLDLTGMAFARILRNGAGQPAELHIIPPHELVNIELGQTTDEIIRKFIFAPVLERHRRLELFWKDVIYFWYPHPNNPYIPFSPMQSLAHVTDMELYMQVYQKDFFQNNARPDFAIVLEKDVAGKGTIERMQEGWNARYRGPGKQHKPAILGPNVKIVPLGIPAKDFEFAALGNFTQDHILGAYRVPKGMLGLMDTYNKAAIIAAEMVLGKEAIGPRLDIFADAINMQLIPQFRNTLGLEFCFDSPLPKDDEWDFTKDQGELIDGRATLNEIRKRNGKSPYKSKLADVPWVNGQPLQGEDKEVDKVVQQQAMGGAAGQIPGAIPGMESNLPAAQGPMGELGGRPEGATLSGMLNEALRASKPNLSALLNAARGKRGGLSSLFVNHPEMASFRALLQQDKYGSGGLNRLLSKTIKDYIVTQLPEEDRLIFKEYDNIYPDIENLEEEYSVNAEQFFVEKGIQFKEIVEKTFSDFVTKGDEYFDIDEETLREDYKKSSQDFVNKSINMGMRLGFAITEKDFSEEDPEFIKAATEASGAFLDKSSDLKVESTKKALTKIIREGIKNGYGADEVSEMIRKHFSDMGSSRAMMIARTELSAAITKGMITSYDLVNKKEGKILIKKAILYVSPDERLCKECADKEGHVVYDFVKKKEIISLPYHPMCRCLPKAVID